MVALAFTACKNETKKAEMLENKTTTWINSFKEFRNAVYQDDTEKIKTFIDFPILNEGNEIWHLIYQNNKDDKSILSLPNETKPFTEADFNKNYHTLFSEPFINSILKIKTDILYKTGSFETVFIKEDESAYKIYASFDKNTNKLELHLYCEKSISYEENGEKFEEKGESSTIYYFDILTNNQLKFRYIRMAG